MKRSLLVISLVAAGALSCSSVGATTASPPSDAEPAEPGPFDVCGKMDQLELSEVSLVDEDGDGHWSPGERATVSALITNMGGDNFHYPGIAVESSHPGVRVEMEGNWLYGMAAGDAAGLEIPVRAEPSVEPGTVVELVVRIDAINQSCDWNRTTFTATIGSP